MISSRRARAKIKSRNRTIVMTNCASLRRDTTNNKPMTMVVIYHVPRCMPRKKVLPLNMYNGRMCRPKLLNCFYLILQADRVK